MKNKIVDLSTPKVRRFKKYHAYLLAGSVLTLASFFLTIVPCQINETKYSVSGLCKLPSPFENLTTTSHVYYGLNNNPIAGLIIQFLISLLVSYGFVYLLKKIKFQKKGHKIVDFTKK